MACVDVTMSTAKTDLHVKDKALQGEAQVGGDRCKPHLAPGIHFLLAEATVVLVVSVQHLSTQQTRLQRSNVCEHCVIMMAVRAESGNKRP